MEQIRLFWIFTLVEGEWDGIEEEEEEEEPQLQQLFAKWNEKKIN